MQFLFFKKIYKRHSFQIAREISCGYLLIIYTKKNFDKYIFLIMQKQSARVTVKNNLFKPCAYGQNGRFQSKQQFPKCMINY